MTARTHSPIVRIVLFALALCLLSPVGILTPAGAAAWKWYEPVGEVVLPPGDANVPRAVEEKDGYVYLLARKGILYTYDLSDLPLRPSYATYNAPVGKQMVYGGNGVLRYGNYLYAFGDNGIQTVDVQDPATPALLGLTRGLNIYNLVRHENYLIAAGQGRVAVYSIAEPSNPALLSDLSLGAEQRVWSAAVCGQTLYVCNWTTDWEGAYTNFLTAIDFSNPARLSVLNAIGRDDQAYHLRIVGDRLLECTSSRVALWDLTTPANPVFLTSQVTNGRVVALKGNHIITNGAVLRPNGNKFERVATFKPNGGQPDDHPYGSAVNASFAFLAQSERVLILNTTLPESEYSGGHGTADDPYQIATAADLIALGETPTDNDKHFVLTADIDLDPNLAGGKVFDKAVIAPDIDPQYKHSDEFQGMPFMGVLDGSDHEIRGLSIEIARSSSWGLLRNYIGLIGQIGEKGQVKRLGLRSVSISAGNAEFVGALAGENRGTILSCHSSGNVTTWGMVGGLVGGHYSGTITSSYTAGSVKGVQVGGLVGLLWTGTVSSCYSTAGVVKYPQVSDVIGYFEYAGGLVGRNWAATISCCYASGDVTADVLAGGLVGTNNEGTIYSCYSSSKVTGDYIAGGLVGNNSGSIVSCYATGDVSGGSNVGGLAGRAADGSIATSYSVGKVTSSSSTASGLVGGDSSTSAFLSYWDLETSGLASSTAGAGKTTQQMMSTATFVGWGHDAQWVLEEGKDYPRLVWEGRPGIPITDPPRTYSGGSGDSNDPYLVRTAADLICLGRFPDDWRAAFALVSNIDLTSIDPNELLRIGTRAIPFTGTFDGRGHTIRGLRVESGRGDGSSMVGMFGRVGPSGVVRHLHLVDVDISGGNYIGGLAGSNEGSILACSVIGNITASDVAGGLAGENKGAVTSSFARCTVYGGWKAGGLVGENRGTISSCYAMGTLKWFIVGGLVGDNKEGTIIACYWTGPLKGRADLMGGLTGCLDREYGTVTASFWDTQTSGFSEPWGGTGLPTSEMQKAVTFLSAGWDFVGETKNGTEDIWWIDEGKDYPRLWWERPENQTAEEKG